MPVWNGSNPCPNCKTKSGTMLRCEHCGTAGCPKCLGNPGKGRCKVCKKTTEKKRL